MSGLMSGLMSGWIAFGISGWIACVLVIVVRRRPSEIEMQLQETAREYASAARRWEGESETIIDMHRAQMDAIHDELINFEVDEQHKDPEAVRRLLDHLRSKTTPRSRWR